MFSFEKYPIAFNTSSIWLFYFLILCRANIRDVYIFLEF
jgi:hypothetical protein